MNSRWLAYLLLGSLSLALGCKSGGGGPSFIEVVDTEPEEGDDNVIVDTRVAVRMSAAIDPATLTSETFFLTDENDALVPSSVEILDEPNADPAQRGTAAELTPSEPLNVLTNFTVTVTTELLSIGGTSLEEDYQWRFTTLDAAWGEDEFLEEIGTGSSTRQQVDVDRQSNAIAVWQYDEGSSASSIWANRYTRFDLWGTPEPIDLGQGGAVSPALAVDDAGNGFAVWEERENGIGPDANIYTNRYTLDQGWGSPELLQTGQVTPAFAASIATHPAGNAMAVWVQEDPDSSNRIIFARRYEPGSGWGAAESIDLMPSGSAGTSTAVGMDDAGNAIALWARPMVPTGGGFAEVLWANRYEAGVGWGTAELIKADPETRARDQRLSVAPNGDAFAIWIQNEGDRDDIWGVRFSGSAWGTPERIDRYDDGSKDGPDIATDENRTAHAVWSQSDVDFDNIYASRYAPGSGWDAMPSLIEPANEDPQQDGDATAPRIGVNAAGNAFVVWNQTSEDWLSVWSNRVDPDMPWVPASAELIEDEGLAAKGPKVVVDENRHAHAVWLHGEGRNVDWVRTNRFE